jgi:hypothetical protein
MNDQENDPGLEKRTTALVPAQSQALELIGGTPYSSQVAAALESLPHELRKRLHPLLRHDYEWCSEENAKECLSQLEAFVLASKHQLPKQGQVYRTALDTITMKDVADRAVAVLKEEYGSKLIPPPARLDGRPYRRPDWRTYDLFQNYSLSYLRSWSSPIPILGLRAMDFLHTSGVVPDGGLILRSLKNEHPLLLCAIYGPWLVSLLYLNDGNGEIINES